MYESQKIHIVTEIVDGEPIETRLPKEKAETLYKKLKAKGADATIQKEELMKTIAFKDTDEVFNVMAEDKRYIIASRLYTIAERNSEIKEWSDGLNRMLEEEHENYNRGFDAFNDFFEDCSEILELEQQYRYDNGDCPQELLEDTFCYTIIDLNQNIRSDDNYIFTPFDYSKKEDCEKALAELNSGAMELSRRNKVDLQLKEPHISAFEAEA